MRIPTPPFIELSRNGDWAGSLYNTELTLVDINNEVSGTRQLPHSGSSLAFSPDGRRLVVAGTEEVSLFQVQPDFIHLATVALPAPLFRMSLTDNGLLVGAARFSETKTTLCVWEGDKLEAAFSGEGFKLGSVAAYQLEIDPVRRLVLLSGASGSGAYSGGAKRFAGLVTLGENKIDLLWKGEGLPFEADGYLFPLASSGLGIYKRDELQLFKLEPSATPILKVAGRFALDNLETVTTSPNGRYLAWRWGDGPETTCQLRVALLDDGKVLQTGELKNIGYFPTMAVSDQGRLTLAFSEQPNRLLFYRLENGLLGKKVEVKTENYNQLVSWSDQA